MQAAPPHAHIGANRLTLRLRRAAARPSDESADHPNVSTAPETVRVPTITVGLRPHPSSLPAPDSNAAAETVSPVGMLLVTMRADPDGSAVFEFRLEDCRMSRLRLPAPVPPAAADELWKHTCFEVFMAVRDEPGYREFNFSPSGQWASYAFRAWRDRIDDFEPGADPQIEVERGEHGLLLRARLPAAALPSVPHGGELQIGLAAVIERSDGELEYWAVRHTPAQPDFHARDTFVLMLRTYLAGAAK